MMKKTGFCIFVLIILLSFFWIGTSLAGEKSISLPKGTTVEKLGQGHFKFFLPNKQIIEVKNLSLLKGTMDYVAVMDPEPPPSKVKEIGDPDPPGKAKEFGDPDPPGTAFAISGKKGKFLRQTKTELAKLPAGTEYVLVGDDVAVLSNSAKVPKTDYIMIDDEIVWLPVGIQFETK
jgi:hypothetical protein